MKKFVMTVIVAMMGLCGCNSDTKNEAPKNDGVVKLLKEQNDLLKKQLDAADKANSATTQKAADDLGILRKEMRETREASAKATAGYLLALNKANENSANLQKTLDARGDQRAAVMTETIGKIANGNNDAIILTGMPACAKAYVESARDLAEINGKAAKSEARPPTVAEVRATTEKEQQLIDKAEWLRSEIRKINGYMSSTEDTIRHSCTTDPNIKRERREQIADYKEQIGKLNADLARTQAELKALKSPPSS
jgi:hypothetical protein